MRKPIQLSDAKFSDEAIYFRSLFSRGRRKLVFPLLVVRAAQSVPHDNYAANVILEMTLSISTVINKVDNLPFLDGNALSNQKYRLWDVLLKYGIVLRDCHTTRVVCQHTLVVNL